MGFRIIEPGLFTLLVDYGRPRSRSLGVPVGGAADRTSLALGNGLVGNPPDAAALEIALAGPTLQAETDLPCVVYGAPFDLNIGQRTVGAGRTFTLQAGEVLRIAGTATGMRAYFCVHGGIGGPQVLASRSALGPLRAGEELACGAGRIASCFIRPHWHWDTGLNIARTFGLAETCLRVIDGAQANWFDRADLYGSGDTLVLPSFTVAPASNRMGLRLLGDPLRLPDEELVSEPVCPGAVQVTRDGQCIILGVDGQTIGGYPKIAQVISADLDKLGQLRPGERVRFQRVTLEEAQNLYRNKQAELRKWLVRLETAETLNSGRTS